MAAIKSNAAPDEGVPAPEPVALGAPAEAPTKAEDEPKPVSGAKPQTKGKLAEFIWRGPVEGLELNDKDKTVWAGTLMPNHTVKLPADHSRVKQLVARKLLVTPPPAAKQEA